LDCSLSPSASSSPLKFLPTPDGAQNPQYPRGSSKNLCTAGSGLRPEIHSLSTIFSEALDCAISVRTCKPLIVLLFWPDKSVLFAIHIGFRERLASNRIIDLPRDFHSPGTELLHGSGALAQREIATHTTGLPLRSAGVKILHQHTDSGDGTSLGLPTPNHQFAVRGVGLLYELDAEGQPTGVKLAGRRESIQVVPSLPIAAETMSGLSRVNTDGTGADRLPLRSPPPWWPGPD
jgi:hypothetical protein